VSDTDPPPRAHVHSAWRSALALLLLAFTFDAGAEDGQAPPNDEPGTEAATNTEAAAPNTPTPAEAAALRADKRTLEARIAALEAQAARLAEAEAARDRARARAAELEARLAKPEAQWQAMARTHTAQLDAAERRAQEQKARLVEVEARIQTLEAELAERAARITRLEDIAQERKLLQKRLDMLRARLPAPEGGTITADTARRQAEERAAALTALVENARGIDNPRLWREVRSAENALHRSQYLLARADDARTVYRVRPGDSLAQISRLFYGTAERWTELFDANRHVIEDPNRLLPGTTLVVP
jgi:nucleoid-associated protein YgaU